MTGAVIFLIILGIIFIFASFALTERNEVEDEVVEKKIPKELSEEQKAKIDKLINDYMDEKINTKLDEIEAKFAEIVNEKTLALGDYAVTVNDEIEKNHNEVTFLYSMLSDKQKEIMTTATMVDDYRKDIEAYVKANMLDATVNVDVENIEEEIKELDEELNAESEETETKPEDGSKDIILEMHKSGLSILEIAKHLGLGVGEVKLVVDLYQGESK